MGKRSYISLIKAYLIIFLTLVNLHASANFIFYSDFNNWISYLFNKLNNEIVEVSSNKYFFNVKPVCSAGVDKTIYLPANSVQLNGVVEDADGEIVKYNWRTISGPSSGVYNNATILNPVISNLLAGVYTIEFAVTDNSANVAKDTMAVTVTTSKRILIDVGKTVTKSPDSYKNYWNFLMDARSGAKLINTKTITNLSSSVSLEVIEQIDGIFNTADSSIGTGNSIGLIGDYQSTATTDFAYAHNSTSTGKWRIFGLPAQDRYTIKFWGTKSGTTSTVIQIKRSSDSTWKEYNAANNKTYNNGATFTFTGETEVLFDIRVKAGNTFGYINVVDIAIGDVHNLLPKVNAGKDISVVLPKDSARLTGIASDADGSIAKYKWIKLSGPSSFTISNDAIANPVIKKLVEGIYTFELTVTDNRGGQAKDIVKVVVDPSLNTLDTVNCGKPFKIVVLGSSTAWGAGASTRDSAWVYKYRKYMKLKNAQSDIINLALSGYTTYHTLCPTGFIPPAKRPAPDTARNITKALSLNPDAIIINLPSNDIGNNYTLEEQKLNYERAIALANEKNIPVWVTTTQPRTPFTTAQRDSLKKLRDWTYERFGSRAVDFWSTIANADGTINIIYDYKDGIHVNNDGHHILYNSIRKERILDELCALSTSSSETQTTTSATSRLTNTTISTKDNLKEKEDKIEILSSFKIVPNPAREHFVLQVSNNKTGVLKVFIYNEIGGLQKSYHVIKDQVTFSKTFVLNELPTGNYIIKVVLGDWQQTNKLIILK